MNISVFNMFSIGIGPSSSHTVGPMRAARVFLQSLPLQHVSRVCVTLYGSLALTGKGHGTNKAILMGLMGEEPQSIDPEEIPAKMRHVMADQKIQLLGKHAIPFNIETDLIYDYLKLLPFHSNAMRFQAFAADGSELAEKIYYSIGGGFIATPDELANPKPATHPLRYPFETATELFAQCNKYGLTVAELMLQNELEWRTESEIRKGLLNIAAVMHECIEIGCKTRGILPGGLEVVRRAPALYDKLMAHGVPALSSPDTMKWLNVYAMAVNEQNAAGSRVVTAPTNGAAGIIPSVLEYYRNFHAGVGDDDIVNYLLTAGAIGILYKKNASISGAEAGCQGEVGVACSMAAAGLAAVLGGNLQQVENAAEIAMEHNLGLTCDPVKGLVQIPCIERNAIGSVKAVNAAQLALEEDRKGKVSLDMVINTMREIGANMNTMYKETARGGLAVNVPDC